ncbi:MAG TPA: glucarate dehydratase family protein [Roseiflexaceae bacterium]|nr:glucarate dehydratase family protein [Roseiflexaceae bacterium]
MRISDMHVTPVAMGDPPLLNAAGLHAPFALRTIVELVTDDGISGIGEVPGGADVTQALESARDIVIGRDPFQLTALSQDIERHVAGEHMSAQATRTTIATRRSSRIFSAVEVACLDIIGKAIGRPVCDLLGGKVRDRVPFSAYLFFKYEGAGGDLGFGLDPQAQGWAKARQAAALDPAGIVAQAQAMCKAFGFKSIKLKGGAMEPDVEVDSILALHEAFGPGTPLRLDPNAIWSVDTAIRRGKRMSGVLEYYEDPVRGQEAMAEVARAVDMPLATNMCTTSFADLPGSIRLGSEQIILSDHHFWGGLRASVDLARICSTFGRGLSMHSNSHLGISLAAMTHLAAAVPNLTYACDTHYPWQWEDMIVGGQLQFEDGSLAVPTEPGLGVELDRAALARLHQCYVDCGLTERNDEIEMQKVQPGWKFQAQRW